MIKKSSLFIILIFTAWLSVMLYITSGMPGLTWRREYLFFNLSFIFLYIAIALFFLNFMTAVLTSLFSRFIHSKARADVKAYSYDAEPKVALLYCTYNDFYEKSLKTCIEQQYRNYHVYVLDDSNDRDLNNRIDRFAEDNKNRMSVIRRGDRLGFKAGNLNNALKAIGGQYEYFAVVDSDSMLSGTFIKDTLSYFSADSRLGYVQASHTGYLKEDNALTSALVLGVELHYKNTPVVKNNYGLNIFYGHDGMIKMDAWKKAGGFPEIVSEDMAFSLAVRSAGYHGIFARDIICQEAFPANYVELRRRSEKWAKGTSEFILLYFPKYIRDKNIYWFEKFDIVLSTLSYILPLPYLFLACIMMIGIFSSFIERPVQIWTYYPAFSSAISMLKIKLSYIGAASMLFIFLFILENSGRKKIKILFKYLAYQVYYFLANFIKTNMDIASFIIMGKADFLVTADRVAIGASKKALHPAKGIAMAIESAGIIAFLGIGVLFKNIWCVLISTASLLGFIILAMPKMNKPVIFTVYLIASLAFISVLAALFAYIR